LRVQPREVLTGVPATQAPDALHALVVVVPPSVPVNEQG
jgi:hypothetical protein